MDEHAAIGITSELNLGGLTYFIAQDIFVCQEVIKIGISGNTKELFKSVKNIRILTV